MWYLWEIRWWQMIRIGIISSVGRVSWWTWLALYVVLPTSHLLKYSFWCFRAWKMVPVELAFGKAWLQYNQARRWWWCFNLYPWWTWNDVIHTIMFQLSLSNLFRRKQRRAKKKICRQYLGKRCQIFFAAVCEVFIVEQWRVAHKKGEVLLHGIAWYCIVLYSIAQPTNCWGMKRVRTSKWTIRRIGAFPIVWYGDLTSIRTTQVLFLHSSILRVFLQIIVFSRVEANKLQALTSPAWLFSQLVESWTVA